MAEFYSRNNLPKTIPQPKCEKIVSTYGKEVQENGTIKVVETGKTNIYEKIQAGKDDCLVYNIIERFKNGDIDALNQRQGQYADITKEPKTLVEYQQSYIDAENYFNSLPLEVRRQFDHNVTDFLQTAINGKLAERHAYFKPPQEVQDAMAQAKAQQNIAEQVVHTPNVVTGGTANE